MIRAEKIGPVLWQLPENFHRDDERLAGALAKLPAGRHCFEFRHESWFAEPVYALLREHGAALVIGDDPSRPFQTHERTTDWTFVRFHSPCGSSGRPLTMTTSRCNRGRRMRSGTGMVLPQSAVSSNCLGSFSAATR